MLSGQGTYRGVQQRLKATNELVRKSLEAKNLHMVHNYRVTDMSDDSALYSG
jgi:hypothetical protein